MVNKVIKGLLMLVITLGLNPIKASAVVDPKHIVSDPAKGTASELIERAIAKGSETVGKGRYIWGGGHRGAPPDHPDFAWPNVLLDCSGFVGAVYYFGAGVSMAEAWGFPVATAYTGESKYLPYVRSGKTLDDAKRGDIITTHGGSHVVIYIGKQSDGKHVVMDSTAIELDLQGYYIGAEAPRGGAVMRATNNVGTILGILDMEKFIKEGEGTAWKKVDAADLANPGDLESNNAGNSGGGAGLSPQFDPSEIASTPLVEYKNEHIDKGVDDANKGVQRKNTSWIDKLFGQ